MEDTEITKTEESGAVISGDETNEPAMTKSEGVSADLSADVAEEPDYESIIREDIRTLRESFPELSALSDISELENPTRYGALRDLGLSPEEAYRATTKRRAARHDNRAHLQSSVPRPATSPQESISYNELMAAREIFGNISDAEIQRLYKKVTR